MAATFILIYWLTAPSGAVATATVRFQDEPACMSALKAITANAAYFMTVKGVCSQEATK